jgi:hypothetical protein
MTQYELKKDIDVDRTMQLLDINGTKNNFQSECIISLKDPSQQVLVAIVNQNDIDNISPDKFNYELCENGVFARKVTYQNNIFLNHFIAIKKHPAEKSEKVHCSVVIRLKELPPPPEPETPSLAPELSPDAKNNIKEELYQLSNSPQYKEIETPSSNYNAYYIVAMICFILFAFIFMSKMRSRNF